jgi:hypothetical protein
LAISATLGTEKVLARFSLLTRQVPTDDARDYAEFKELQFIETSAKDGTNCTKAMRLVLQGKTPSFSSHIPAIYNGNTDSSIVGGFSLGSVFGKGEEGEEGDGEEEEGCC